MATHPLACSATLQELANTHSRSMLQSSQLHCYFNLPEPDVRWLVSGIPMPSLTVWMLRCQINLEHCLGCLHWHRHASAGAMHMPSRQQPAARPASPQRCCRATSTWRRVLPAPVNWQVGAVHAALLGPAELASGEDVAVNGTAGWQCCAACWWHKQHLQQHRVHQKAM